MRNSMTSKAKFEANRANGRRSAGPRTAAGKARASRNALRHGLNTPIEADHPQLAIIEAWALRFCNSQSTPTRHARAAAMAQAELSRVRAAKVTALRLAAERIKADKRAPKAALTAQALIASLPDLLKLDGYERKARSKRDKAFRELIT
jgi:hypothetical protein